MERILVWGLSNRRAGTEMVVDAYASSAEGVSFDFLGYDYPAEFGHLLEGTDNRAFVIPAKSKNPLGYYRELNRFMREHAGEYSALWFNLNNMANIDPLVYAKRYGIERRIVHSHNSSEPPELLLRMFSAVNAARCRRLATDRWACSAVAGEYVFGGEPFRVVPNLIDVERCSFSEIGRKRVRERYELEGKRVVGTVGRLCEQKNPMFLVEVFADALRRDSALRLMFVGEGELRDAVEARARETGIAEAVIFAGSQSNVRDFLSAFDVFAFPSIYEGLGLAFLEAQFNGLPCVVSEVVPQGAVISTAARSVPLNDKSGWAKALLSGKRVDGSLLPERADAYSLKKAAGRAARLFSCDDVGALRRPSKEGKGE